MRKVMLCLAVLALVGLVNIACSSTTVQGILQNGLSVEALTFTMSSQIL